MAIKEIKHKSLPLDKSIELKDILGKKVLTKDGKNLGKIRSVRMHPEKLTIEGIEVDAGLFKIDWYIGKNYIKRITDQGAMLKIDPVDEIIGHQVFDSTGKNIGEIKSVNRSKKTNKLLQIIVYSDLYQDNIEIDSHYIENCGDSCILKEPIKDII
ncbi:MAG: PRC-barrel domain-containing protein, partial [Candidatus Thermoplasmatota archaeon]|nr:PRC-barrel domain-containing protein [Candidatus Thermoplasmatota archaeon]